MSEHPKESEKNQTGGVTLQQRLALDAEVRASIKLIEAGLGQLQRITGANDFYHLPMLTLSSGFERLMKTIICLYIFRETAQFPDKKSRKAFPTSGKKGHDLIWLLDDITQKYFDKDYVEGPRAASDDLEYLCKDAQLREIVEVLSDFAQSARYYNMDVILGDEPTTLSPEHQWEKRVENVILKEDNDWARQWVAADLNELYEGLTTKMVIRLERFARALVRLFTIGGLGPEAKQYTGVIAPFLFLRGDDLGKRKY